jgi:hypothetical protein
MAYRRIRIARTATALAAAALALGLVHAGSLEGRWRLDEQHYGDGGANLADPESPVYLEFASVGEMLSGSTWAGEDPATAVPWPAFVADDGTRPVDVDERMHDPIRGEVRVRYRVRPSSTDGLVLEIVEHYRVGNDGDSLTGSADVKFVRDGEPRGGFVLHRRFVRVP